MIKPHHKLHNTDDSMLQFNNVPLKLQRIDTKPKGLWYSFGTQWVDWCSCEMPDWIKPYNYQLDVLGGNILKIFSEEDLLKFNDNFSTTIQFYPKGPQMKVIDWTKVCSEYDGIEIANKKENYEFFWKFRYDPDFSWYNSWDIGSGCIWNKCEMVIKAHCKYQ